MDSEDISHLIRVLQRSNGTFITTLLHLIEQNSVSIIITDFLHTTEYVNSGFEKITGYSQEEVLGKNLDLLISHKNKEELCAEIFESLNFSNVWTGELSNQRKNGELFWEHATITSLRNKEGVITHYVAIKTDITRYKEVELKLRESEKKYRDLSITDDLTQIYNQRYFYDNLRLESLRANRYRQKLSLILFDIDNFKKINDTYGHISGDLVLAQFGKVLKESLRETDSCYRYGGEEFVVLLPMTTLNDALIVARKIKKDFKKEKFTFSSSEPEVSGITVSVGVVEYLEEEAISEFVKRADTKMYQAKNTGKDKICF